jgi:pyrimidine operon attenuation protein/uracil phosphoribosyltransferase
VAKTKTLGSDAITAAINRLADSISQRHANTKDLILLGIADGGIELTHRLVKKLKVKHTGTLDISFHRDDIGQNPIPKEFAPTIMPFDVNGATVILVDDVLCSGRTGKAALDELFDHGRPTKVELAVLVDRGGRMLPMAADYTGIPLDAKPSEKVVVSLHSSDASKDYVSVETAKTKSKIEKPKSKIS